MENIEGIKLEEREPPFTRFAIIFRVMDELSQDIGFNNESDCDKIFQEIIEGKGILLNYDFGNITERIFPTWAAKVQVLKDYIVLPNHLWTKTANKLGHHPNQSQGLADGIT